MRKSGILMHLTSLPGPWGIGTMGQAAYQFIDFLHQAGQRAWQILPLTPTGFGNSPYQSCSTYAGNHYLIDLAALVKQGLLEQEEIDAFPWSDSPTRVNFGLLYKNRLTVLKKAYHRFAKSQAFWDFCRQQADWLEDFCLFMALKDKFSGLPWYQWENALKFRDPQTLAFYRQELEEDIRFYCFLQYLFFTQWDALRSYAHEKGIAIIGDVPIYVPYDSVDVWSNPRLFALDETLTPIAVAGCPPDAFSQDGQLWGNPLYRWDVHKAQDYRWWTQRMAAAGERYDVVRLDHFRGFEAYWSVPYGDTTAKNGKWIKGPALDFIHTLNTRLPHLEIIAEDLGLLTPEVRNLQKASGYPGMKVLGFAFDSREPSEYLPHFYTPNCVCYTGTHDNMTTRQWFETASPDAVQYATEYMRLTEEEGYVWGTIRTAMASVSQLCIIPMQDYLELGSEARMNLPGTLSEDNWAWRATSDYISPGLTQRIRRMTELYGRLKTEKQ